ncbi:RDD family protein [Calidifontibacter terrae]
MSERPSGWYPDQNDDSLLRYWDGILWTDRTMPRIKPGLEHSTIATPPQVQQHPQQPQHAAAQPPSGGPQPYGGPYAPAPQKQIPQTPDGQELSGWWRRGFALLIDGLLCTLISFPLSWPWLGPWVRDYADWFRTAMDAAQHNQAQPAIPSYLAQQFPWQFALIAAIVFVVYETLLTAFTGRTLGKLCAGIRVRRTTEDRPPNLGSALYRTLIKNLNSLTSAIPLLGLAGLVFQIIDFRRPLSDPHRQSFHDRWATTYVVRSAPKSAPNSAPNSQQQPPRRQ